MKKNVFAMREDSMNNTVRGLDKCYMDADSTGKNIPNNFAGMSRAGMFDMGISTINQQVGSITNSIFNVKNIVNKHSNEMFDMDRGMARAARKIEIPQDFVTTNANQTNTFNSYLLEKIDGKSVNAGSELGTIANVADSGIAGQQVLGNINNNVATEEKKLDERTGIVGQNLGTINNNQSTVEQSANEVTGIVGQTLNNINNKGSVSEQQLDNSTGILAATLTDMNASEQGMTNQYLDLNPATIGSNISNIVNKTSSNINSNNEGRTIVLDEGLERIVKSVEDIIK